MGSRPVMVQCMPARLALVVVGEVSGFAGGVGDQAGCVGWQVEGGDGVGDGVGVAQVEGVDEVLFPVGGVLKQAVDEFGEGGEVFAGVVVVDDLGGVRGLLVGDGPDPFRAVAEHDGLSDLVESAA